MAKGSKKTKVARKTKEAGNVKAAKKTTISPIALLGIAGVVIVAAVVLVVMLNRGEKAGSRLASEISVSDAFDRRQAGAFILDVRQPEEWEDYHIPGSTLIPLGDLQSRVSELPRDQEIVVVCRTGNRSQEGRDILVQAGFQQVTSMSGGVSAWRSAGYPVESGK